MSSCAHGDYFRLNGFNWSSPPNYYTALSMQSALWSMMVNKEKEAYNLITKQLSGECFFGVVLLKNLLTNGMIIMSFVHFSS